MFSSEMHIINPVFLQTLDKYNLQPAKLKSDFSLESSFLVLCFSIRFITGNCRILLRFHPIKEAVVVILPA